MPMQSPIPDEVDQEFWDACNENRLVIQYCTTCSRYQYPPLSTCTACGSSVNLCWREVEGEGTIYSYGVVYDTPIASLKEDVPFNCAVIDLDDCPGINMFSRLPGTPPDEVPIGARVRVTFEATPGNGQKVPEWRVLD
jgi:uncharacterized protein